ncbi:glycosyltransferase family 9 protein [bacterium]|nr:glycosyltransferase family 9 protein [bacterium]
MYVIYGYGRPLSLDGLANKNEVKHVVLSSTGHLGDLILFTPCLRIVRNSFPSAEISICIAPKRLDVNMVKNCPYIDSCVEHRYDDMSVHREMVAKLRAKKPELAIALPTSTLDYKFCSQVKAKYRIGRIMIERFMRLFFARFWMTHLIPIGYRPSAKLGVPITHVVPGATLPLKMLGCDCSDLSLELFLDEPSRKYAAEVFAHFGEPDIALHLHQRLFNNGDPNNPIWEYRDLIGLIKQLLNADGAEKKERKILITYGPFEAKIADSFRAALAETTKVCVLDGSQETLAPTEVSDASASILFAGNLPFLRWAAMLEHTKLVITPDTGSVHVAAALHKPVIDIFPVTHYAWNVQSYYPWQTPNTVIKKDTPERTIPKILDSAQKFLNNQH